jgi:hypothetical protein
MHFRGFGSDRLQALSQKSVGAEKHLSFSMYCVVIYCIKINSFSGAFHYMKRTRFIKYILPIFGTVCNLLLKGQCHEIFNPRFFPLKHPS